MNVALQLYQDQLYSLENIQIIGSLLYMLCIAFVIRRPCISIFDIATSNPAQHTHIIDRHHYTL